MLRQLAMKRQSQQVTSHTGSTPFPIVGIGTSAGGLEALELFLSHVPRDCGMAFVVIQHLSPTHVGNLPELLQRSTTMKVSQVNSATKVQPDRVYVIPPNKDLLISKRTLHLLTPNSEEKHGLRLPIDSFLTSLAVDCAERSIGVILSGMGSDGTQGVRSIKKQGGLTLAQEPATAKFDSMPKSAINADLIDIVAPAEELPSRIMAFLGCTKLRVKDAPDFSDKEQGSLNKIITQLKARTRHDFSLYKPNSIYRRIERRMSIHKIDSVAGYARFLQKNSHEVDLLFKELLIGVTSFFRDAVLWEELKSEALPKILAAYPKGGSLRAWSCGCSTGEEPYSLAILFKEALDQLKPATDCTLQIFATDLDVDAVDKARRGLYDSTIEADVSPERLLRFFKKEDNKYRVCSEIREMVTFAQQNVVMDPPFTKLDILICRNLLIYLSTELQKKLLPLFHYSLKPGGLLFLGSAESIGSHIDLFTAAYNRSKFYWRNNIKLQNDIIAFPSFFISNVQTSLPQEPLMLKPADNLQLLADNLILQYCSTPTVLTSDQGDIVYINGKTGTYLEPAAGKANMNIFAMVREGLRHELGSAFSKALQHHEPVSVRGTLTDAHNYTQSVDMMLMKIEVPEALRGLVLISFKDVSLPAKTGRKKPGPFPESKQIEEYEQELRKTRQELRTNREEMQTTHEELKSTNEELQSTNEELQSTNEELTTSKEELQSMNEELQSVNAEQTSRLEDFIQINNDMENLLNSTEIVTIFLDNHLQVRRFTTGANRLFKLIPGDLGRPLTDIVSNLDYPHLYDHVHDVLRKLISVENRVSSLDGRWYLVRILPYRTIDKKIDGVVITCSDITEAIKNEDELRREIEMLKKQIAS